MEQLGCGVWAMARACARALAIGALVFSTLSGALARAQDVEPVQADTRPVPVAPTSYGGAAALVAPGPAAIPRADARQAALLEAWLRETSGYEKFGRIFGGVALTVFGPTAGALGAWLILDPQFHTSDSTLATSVGALGIGVGALGLATGIFVLSTELAAEERIGRFAEDAADGIDVHELGLYEGELRAYADAARLARPVAIVGGVAVAVGGGLAMGLTAASDDHLSDDEMLWGLAIGGGFVAAGVIVALTSLIETPYERAWRSYQDGVMPDGAPPRADAVHLDVAPQITPQGGGVSVVGTF